MGSAWGDQGEQFEEGALVEINCAASGKKGEYARVVRRLLRSSVSYLDAYEVRPVGPLNVQALQDGAGTSKAAGGEAGAVKEGGDEGGASEMLWITRNNLLKPRQEGSGSPSPPNADYKQ